jgi:AcrR family transcriptional regulator
LRHLVYCWYSTAGSVFREIFMVSRGEETRRRIMDVAQESVLAKGFDATSIDEIVANSNITKSGFFYHFRDKNALAAALIERHIKVEDQLFDDLFGRARELTDDPGCSLTRGLMSSSPVCSCRVHCSLRSRILASALWRWRTLAD